MEKVTAMPYLCDSTDFGLSDETANKKYAAKLMAKPHTAIRDLNDGVVLYRSGSATDGSLFLYNPATQLIGYFVRYETANKKLVGHSVTQVAVWRSLEEPKSRGLALWVVFDYFLKHYPAIMSDKMQTDRGRDFWIDLISQALARGHRVALADFNLHKVHEIENHAELRLWNSGSGDATDAWGQLNRHMALRFIIFAK